MSRAHFEWDPDKDVANQAKHHVSFMEAQHAFADPGRVIARDLEHSQAEERFYCSARSTAVCLRFGSHIAMGSSAFSEPVIGAEGRRFMSDRIKYTSEPIGKVEIVPDFLPSPAELAFREEGVKVTLALSKKSVEFFKSQATMHHTQYQKMIRRLLDSYVDSQESLASTAGRRARARRGPA